MADVDGLYGLRSNIDAFFPIPLRYCTTGVIGLFLFVPAKYMPRVPSAVPRSISIVCVSASVASIYSEWLGTFGP